MDSLGNEQAGSVDTVGVVGVKGGRVAFESTTDLFSLLHYFITLVCVLGKVVATRKKSSRRTRGMRSGGAGGILPGDEHTNIE